MERFTLSGEAQRVLLSLARKALEMGAREYPKRGAVFGGGSDFVSRIVGEVTNMVQPTPELRQERGVFVTLRLSGALRGCIGTFTPPGPLYRSVPEYTLQSGFFDPRFPPVTTQEMPQIKIEISVLSPLQKVDSPEDVVVGKHGIYVRRGGRAGCYLPEVATDYGMSREEFLSSCCAQKAGLPPDAWQQKETEIFVFTTFKFRE